MYGLKVQAVCLLLMILTAVSAGCEDKEQSVKLEEAEISESLEETASLKTEDEDKIEEDLEGTIFVHVCGHVKEPGVYEFPAGSRICEAVEAAGGMLDTASCEAVNQAQQMQDGEQIYVPSKEEAAGSVHNEAGMAGENLEGKDDGRIDLNTADKSQLMSLTGIGEMKAQAIIAYRQEHGSFHTPDEIMQVEGIKEGTYEKIKDQIKTE